MNHGTILTVGILTAATATLMLWSRRLPLTGTFIEAIGLAVIYVTVYAIVLLVIKWFFEYWGARSRTSLLSSLLFSLIVNIAITIVFDLDKIFIPFHAIILVTFLSAPLVLMWRYLSVFSKHIITYGFSLLITWSALQGKPLLDFVYTSQCVFITRDNVPLIGELASCRQVSALHPLLWPIYIVLTGGCISGIWFLWTYLQNKAPEHHRKLALSLSLLMIPLFPLTFHDINNYGEVDIISQKTAIYESYNDILGRDPEKKDLEFYGRTRAYRHLSRIEAVLYASRERRIKINLLYQEVLGRPASEEEIQYYVTGRQSVQEILKTLERQ